MPVSNLQQKLDEIKSRCDKATPGPWSERRWNDDGHIIEVNDSTGWKKDFPQAYIACLGGWGYSLKHDNGAFITHSRTDIPKLLAVIEKLMEQRDTFGAELFGYRKGIYPSELNDELLKILEEK